MKATFLDWIILACAAWLYASPFAFDTATLSNPATALAWVCAVVLMISASEAFTFPDVIEGWVEIAAGIALVAGPWIFAFDNETGPAMNSVVVGVVVAACAAVGILRERRSRSSA